MSGDAEEIGQKSNKKEISICKQFSWRKDMKYVISTSDIVNTIYSVLHTTIKTIYPKYYPKEVVDFFANIIVKSTF